MPYLDGSFSLVITRFSLHHLDDPNAAIREMARVCRRDGRVVVADMVASPDPAAAAGQDRLERMRDPSHVRMLSAAELARALEEEGLDVVDTRAREVVRPVEQWLEQSRTDPA